MSFDVLEGAAWVASQAKDVKVCVDNADFAAAKILAASESNSYSIASWHANDLHPHHPDDTTLDWLFVLDSLNFCFWSDSDELFTVDYKGRKYTGYWSLVAALNRAIDEGIAITTPSFYKDVTDEQLAHVFRSNSPKEAQLLAQRAEILRVNGRVLCEKFQGTFRECVRQSEHSAQELLSLVVENFPSFHDSATYHGRLVWLLKRAQILIADIWGCYQAEGWGSFHDIDTLTMFADYRVPQALVHVGLLDYSDELASFLASKTEMASGDVREVEIRACSIWAVEVLRRAIVRLQSKLKAEAACSAGTPSTTTTSSSPSTAAFNAITLDFYLWDFAKAQAAAMAHVPIHRVRSVFY